MNDFPKIERDRALLRIIEHMRAAIGHLRAATHDARTYGIVIYLPPEKPLVEVIDACAHIYKKPAGTAP